MSIPTEEQLIKRINNKLLIMRCTEPLSRKWLKAEDMFLNLLMFNSKKLTEEERAKFDALYQNTNPEYSQRELSAVA